MVIPLLKSEPVVQVSLLGISTTLSIYISQDMFVFLIMFFTHMETLPFPAATKGCNFNLYSAFQIIEH